jgi:branched-chain amino acid transport system permease protein
MESIAVLAMVVLGGMGHIPGVMLGGVLLAALPEVLRHVAEPLQMAMFGQVWIDAEVLRQLLYGLAMVIIMLTRPAGLWPSPRHEDRPKWTIPKSVPPAKSKPKQETEDESDTAQDP